MKLNLVAPIAVATTLVAIAVPLSAAQAQSPATVNGPLNAPGRTQVSVDHTFTGLHAGTPNENEARYSLSLTKLLLADYIFERGSQLDKDKAFAMIQRSDDGLASELAGRYPQAIGAKAAQYRMNSAVPASTWGNWRFSSADWSRYLSAKHREDPTGRGPLLTAMRTSAPVGADGYPQRYGVANVPGTIGWKSGWSDDRTSQHASVGFGNDWTVAVQTNGTAGDLDNDLNQALRSGTPAGPLGSSAQGSARAAVDGTIAWVNQIIGPLNPDVANAINAGIQTVTTPIVNALP